MNTQRVLSKKTSARMTTVTRVSSARTRNQTATEAATLRRSPRNLPPHLKEQVQPKPAVEKDPYIESLPEILFKGQVNYASNFNDCAMICDDIIQEVEKHESEIVPLGFDLEWPFNFQSGSGKTALAQLCLNSSVCHLLHIHDLKKLPATFVLLLSHPKVRLVGVNIKNDVWKLGRDFKEFPAQKVVENNCIDCGVFANQVYKRSCRWSLERLTAYVLKQRISKDPKVRRSKWHIKPLSPEQKSYAATDVYTSWLLHTTIQEKANQLKAEEGNEDTNNK